MIALKVKLDLLGVSLRDLLYLGSIAAQLFSTWRGHYVRPRETSSFIQHYSWLPFQCLWILNGHLLSWNQAGYSSGVLVMVILLLCLPLFQSADDIMSMGVVTLDFPR